MKQTISKRHARSIWLDAQKLSDSSSKCAFGSGVAATQSAVEHLGYVQIDTINVVERCHHHILFNRIPSYKRSDLQAAQSKHKTVFEYWTHALSYVPTRDFPYYVGEMRRTAREPNRWFKVVKNEDYQRVLSTIRKTGPISIRDVKDDVLVEKDHDWASRKPSKRALQLGFYTGKLTISERIGMLKKYDLTTRHFGWRSLPRAPSALQTLDFLIDRSLRSQGFISLDSICHLRPKLKAQVRSRIEKRVRAGLLMPIKIEGCEKKETWISPESLNVPTEFAFNGSTHILSPFDSLIIQRKRLHEVFGYQHIFEAYVPKEKRKFGYFTLPVLHDGTIVSALDLKTDRANGKLLIQRWNWLAKHRTPSTKHAIESALDRFEKFQLAED